MSKPWSTLSAERRVSHILGKKSYLHPMSTNKQGTSKRQVPTTKITMLDFKSKKSAHHESFYLMRDDLIHKQTFNY